MTIVAEGDLHRSEGVIPCPDPRCRKGYRSPPEHDILVLQYLCQAVLSLASSEEKEALAKSLAMQAAAHPTRQTLGKTTPRVRAEDQIHREHRAAIDRAIALILR
jgi:hypothetical protein